MNTIKLILWLALGTYAACSKVNLTADFATAAGTRANLKGNFDELDLKADLCFDSVDEVRGRFSGYTGTLVQTSLENLRLRIDGDGSTTGIFLVETSNGDSLFRVKEDSTAKFFGNLSVDGTSTLTGAATLTAAPVLSALTASLPVFTNGSKALASNAMTGTGSVVMSASPTLTGTLAAASGTYSGTLGLTGAFTGTSGAFSTTLGVTGASTLGTLSATSGTFSSTLGVTGILTGTASGAGSASGFISSAAAPAYALRETDAAADNGWWDISANAEQLRFRAVNDANSASGNFMTVDRTGTTIDAVAFPGAALNVTGLLTATGGVLPGLGSDGQGRIFQSSVNGLKLRGVTGSANDFAIANADNTTIMSNPTGTTGVTFPTTVTLSQAPVLSALTASLPVFTNGSKAATSNAMTGTGSVVMSASPTLTGTIGAASQTLSGTLGVTGVATFTAAPVFSSVTASQILSVDGSKGLTSTATTGTGSVVLATSPTLVTPALGAATATSIVASGNVTADSLISSKFYEEGSFTGTLTGVSGSVTNTVRFVRVGKQVTILIPQFIGTSNATTCTITGMSASIRPSREVAFLAQVMDNTSFTGGSVGSEEEGLSIGTSGTITLYVDGNAGGFTAAGIKGLYAGAPDVTTGSTTVIPFSYTLQ